MTKFPCTSFRQTRHFLRELHPSGPNCSQGPPNTIVLGECTGGECSRGREFSSAPSWRSFSGSELKKVGVEKYTWALSALHVGLFKSLLKISQGENSWPQPRADCVVIHKAILIPASRGLCDPRQGHSHARNIHHHSSLLVCKLTDWSSCPPTSCLAL